MAQPARWPPVSPRVRTTPVACSAATSVRARAFCQPRTFRARIRFISSSLTRSLEDPSTPPPQPVQLTGGFATVNNTNNPGVSGVRLAPGVTLKQIEKLFHAKRVPLTSLGRAGAAPLQFLAVDPSLIGPDGRANPAFIVPNRTPGDFGQILFIRDRNTFTWDMSISKSIRFMERMQLQLFAGANDILNHPRWGIPDTNVFSTTFGVVSGPGYRNTTDFSVGTYGRTINLRATLSF